MHWLAPPMKWPGNYLELLTHRVRVFSTREYIRTVYHAVVLQSYCIPTSRFGLLSSHDTHTSIYNVHAGHSYFHLSLLHKCTDTILTMPALTPPSCWRRPASSRYNYLAMERQPCVYMLTNRRNGTLYVGVTSDLPKRIWQHKNKVVEGFTKKYDLDILVWFELHEIMLSAIEREKAIKCWKRHWKLKAIEALNPDWRDLFKEII